MKLTKLVKINKRANPQGLRDCRQVSSCQSFPFLRTVLSRPRAHSWCHCQHLQLAGIGFAIRDRKTFKVPAQMHQHLYCMLKSETKFVAQSNMKSTAEINTKEYTLRNYEITNYENELWNAIQPDDHQQTFRINMSLLSSEGLEKGELLTLQGLEFRLLGRPTGTQSLYSLRYRGS
jgi:hypothetical protein